MSRGKDDQSLTPNVFGTLNEDVARVIASHSSVNHILSLMSVCKTTYNLFKPNLALVLAPKAQVCAVQGNPDGLALIAKHIPDALFVKLKIADPYGRIFYSISTYQLYTFLCDGDMKKQIAPFIPERLNKLRQEQYAELGIGGPDLIKLSFDPIEAAKKDFKNILAFKATYELYDRTKRDVTFPLFENKDAIIYYREIKGQANFYYANRETKEISQLSECTHSEDDKEAFEGLIASFDNMENNSSRRSSDGEHQLIERIFKRKLHREGIQYEQDGIRYRDSRTSFPVVNAYRKCMRVYDGASKEVDEYWCKGVGKAQGVVMWILQRFCENRVFQPLPTNFDNFNRGVMFYDGDLGRYKEIFDSSKLVDSLG